MPRVARRACSPELPHFQPLLFLEACSQERHLLVFVLILASLCAKQEAQPHWTEGVLCSPAVIWSCSDWLAAEGQQRCPRAVLRLAAYLSRRDLWTCHWHEESSEGQGRNRTMRGVSPEWSRWDRPLGDPGPHTAHLAVGPETL